MKIGFFGMVSDFIRIKIKDNTLLKDLVWQAMVGGHLHPEGKKPQLRDPEAQPQCLLSKKWPLRS